ncbi:MAG: amino acid permease [bacterium]|nr:amino acid permease [bacterium]
MNNSATRPEPKGLGTAPVFFAAIGTILGAIMFLRMGYSVAHVGLLGTFGILILGHLVTIPTAMAIAEIATNDKVEGGGEYFIISRSFGLSIGAAIGVGLYLSQAISVAFYLIAFAQVFEPVFAVLRESTGLPLHDLRFVSIPSLALLALIMYTRGADMGTAMLYGIVAVLSVAILLFFLGSTGYEPGERFYLATVEEPDDFFKVFAVIFPAFTGMTMGVGLSGDLARPRKSIPLGTLAATFLGLFVYALIAYKLATSAGPEQLGDKQLVMSDIALWGPAILIGLGCAAMSSALSSLMVAPRTLQALAKDRVLFTGAVGRLLRHTKPGSDEPRGALFPTVGIALAFVALGDVNVVAGVITMFFMVIYGTLCIISFLNHFASDPSYRPAFRSRWYISLLGAVCCVYFMFRINALYAGLSLGAMAALYLAVRRDSDERGLVALFEGALQQTVNLLQVRIQKANVRRERKRWRPAVVCLSSRSFKSYDALDLLRWIAHRHGFSTYIHLLTGYLSKVNARRSDRALERLVTMGNQSHSNVYFTSVVSPSYTSALAQVLQLPGISGRPNNTIVFDYDREKPDELSTLAENFNLIKTRGFDVLMLGSTRRKFGYRREIDVWITDADHENAELLILLAYVILGHPDWAHGKIHIKALCEASEQGNRRQELETMIESGRLPVSPRHLNIIEKKRGVSLNEIVNEYSAAADLTIVGFRGERLMREQRFERFTGYPDVGNMLFVNTMEKKSIE